MHRDFRVVNLLYSFALFALLCTCYPSLQCAENVQKCAEPKSALQDDLKLNGFPAGFLGHRQSKNSQFHPDNNLTSYTGFMAGFRTSEQTPFDCIAVEDEYGNAPAQRAELDWLLYNKPLEYVQMVLEGEMERYLSLSCNHGRLED